MHNKIISSISVVSMIMSLVVLGFLPHPTDVTNAANTNQKVTPAKLRQVKKFTSAADFKNYLKKSGNLGSSAGLGMRNLALPSLEKSTDQGLSASGPDRYSSTNVQVFGIDEPDIVKTDGQNIFLSSPKYYPLYKVMRQDLRIAPGIIAPEYPSGEVKIIKSWPAEELAVTGKINASGEMLLKDNVLVTLSGNTIYGHDVSDKANPKELWKAELGKRDSLVGTRLYNGKIYLATAENIYYPRPCPMEPLTVKGKKIVIPCGQIYHPVIETPTDIVYNVFTLNLSSGAVENKVSFTGSVNGSILYMSPNAIYVTYFYPGDQIKFGYNFLSANRDLVPSAVIDKLARLQTFDISDSSKQNEFYFILNSWQNELDDDERMRIHNELKNRIEKYYPEHQRELEQTGIVKIMLSDFKVKAVGTVPGTLLNQFSLDEYDNNLRIATTVGQGFWSLGWISASAKQANDVYVLGDNMAVVGSIKDLGKDERIYSARFIGDRGYLVTFKQIDPFYVLDLSNPASPSVKGELKVPGYSGYLEPLSDHLVLGVGREENKVKVALYDVSNPSNPVELSKFILDEYWSEALSNHRAFLKDDKHKVFFIPGSQGGYIFSYEGNKLTLAKTISGYSIQRAVYLGDSLYIIGQDRITVLNENNWEKVKELTF